MSIDCKTVEEGYKQVGGLYFHCDTPQEVCAELLRAYVAGYRVRLFYGNSSSGICWNETSDVMGTVRCSTGRIKIPILVRNRSCHGGPAISTSNVIRIVRIDDKNVLYTHPAFDYVNNYAVEGSTVSMNGNVILNAPTPERAEKFKEFMLGHRFSW